MGHTCEWCGESFESNNGANRFCSRDCYGEWLSENNSGKEHHQSKQREVDCSWCGETLLRAPNRLERSDNHFCDNDCYTKWRSENVVGENHHNHKEPAKVECLNCAGVFEVTPARKETAKYCSRGCMSEHYKERDIGRKEEKEYRGDCEYCGNEVYKIKSYPKVENIFCGKGCYDSWQRENSPTGKDHWNWNGGLYEYGSGWHDSKKRRVRKRDNYECVICGLDNEEHKEEYGRSLSVHHIIPARKFDSGEKANDINNLTTMCIQCHRRWEGVPLKPE